MSSKSDEDLFQFFVMPHVKISYIAVHISIIINAILISSAVGRRQMNTSLSREEFVSCFQRLFCVCSTVELDNIGCKVQ